MCRTPEIHHTNDSFIASKELIRAVITNNLELAKKIFADGSPVASLVNQTSRRLRIDSGQAIPRSADIKLTGRDYAVLSNNCDMLKLFEGEAETRTKRAKAPLVSIKSAVRIRTFVCQLSVT